MRSNDRSSEGDLSDCDPSGSDAGDRFAEIESLIASAGHYVWPSDDLRPRVLEVARERAGQRHTLYRLTGMMVAATLCVMTGISVSHHLRANAQSAAMPRGEQLEQRIDARVAASGQTHDWALADIVAQWRSELATRLPADAAAPREMENGKPIR